MEEQILKMIEGSFNPIEQRLHLRDASKEITIHSMAFAKWGIENTVRLYYRNEIYQILETKISVKSVEELYIYWLTNVNK